MTFLQIILIILVGIILLLVELFIFTGSTIAGVAGTILWVVGVIAFYYYYGTVMGHWALGISLLLGIGLAVATGRWLGKRDVGLTNTLDGKMNTTPQVELETGMQGVAFSDLKPYGKVTISGKIYDLQSEGGYISKGTQVSISNITPQEIVVKSV